MCVCVCGVRMSFCMHKSQLSRAQFLWWQDDAAVATLCAVVSQVSKRWRRAGVGGGANEWQPAALWMATKNKKKKRKGHPFWNSCCLAEFSRRTPHSAFRRRAQKKKWQKEKKLNALPLCAGFSYFPALLSPPAFHHFPPPRAHTMR